MINRGPLANFSVLIPDGESSHALPVLRCLGQLKNIRIIILSDNTRAPIRFSRHTGQFFSYANKEGNAGRLAAIIKIAEQTKPDIILPVDEPTIRLFAGYKEALSKIAPLAPIPDCNSFDIAADKWLLAEWLRTHNISHPRTILYQNEDVSHEALSGMSFPVLLKPRHGSAGIGIEYFDNPLALNRYCKERILPEEYIVQSFTKGYDIDCSVICKEGEILAYTIQKGFMNGTYRFSIPAGIEFVEDESAYGIVAGLVKRFNWSGIIHIDLRYDEQDQQIKVIEMNPRFWGSLLASTFAGVNFPYLACLAGLNRKLPEIIIHHKRVVHPKATLSLLAKRLIPRKQKNLHFDHTIMEFILKDPMPAIYNEFTRIFKKR